MNKGKKKIINAIEKSCFTLLARVVIMSHSLVNAVLLDDVGLIKEILKNCPMTISDQHLAAAQDACYYMKREYLLQYLRRPSSKKES